jgi:hypothetical protein
MMEPEKFALSTACREVEIVDSKAIEQHPAIAAESAGNAPAGIYPSVPRNSDGNLILD